MKVELLALYYDLLATEIKHTKSENQRFNIHLLSYRLPKATSRQKQAVWSRVFIFFLLKYQISRSSLQAGCLIEIVDQVGASSWLCWAVSISDEICPIARPTQPEPLRAVRLEALSGLLDGLGLAE